MRKTEMTSQIERASAAGQLGLLLAFGVLGYLAGSWFGVLVGAGFSYMAWWLREIHDDIKQHLVKTDELISKN